VKFALKRSIPKWVMPKRATTKWVAQKWSLQKDVLPYATACSSAALPLNYPSILANCIKTHS